MSRWRFDIWRLHHREPTRREKKRDIQVNERGSETTNEEQMDEWRKTVRFEREAPDTSASSDPYVALELLVRGETPVKADFGQSNFGPSTFGRRVLPANFGQNQRLVVSGLANYGQSNFGQSIFVCLVCVLLCVVVCFVCCWWLVLVWIVVGVGVCFAVCLLFLVVVCRLLLWFGVCGYCLITLRTTPPPDPFLRPRLRGHRGFTQQPENSKREHLTAPALPNNTNTRRPSERERDKKERKWGKRKKKKNAKLLGPPPCPVGPRPLEPHPSGSHFFWV